MRAAFLVLFALAGCPSDSVEDSGDDDVTVGSGSGSGSGSASSEVAQSVDGDASLNQFVFGVQADKFIGTTLATNIDTTIIAYGLGLTINSVAFVDTVAVFALSDHGIGAIDVTTGESKFSAATIEGRSFPSFPEIAARDGDIYAVNDHGIAVELDTSGTKHWTYAATPSGSPDENYYSYTRPLVTDSRVYIGTDDPIDQNYLHAIDRATGQRIWAVTLAKPLSGTPVEASNVLLLPAGDLYAIDPDTHAAKWTFDVQYHGIGGGSARVGTPVVANDRIYVQGPAENGDGALYCLDLATGHVIWSVDAGVDSAGEYMPTVVGKGVFGIALEPRAGNLNGDGVPFLVDIATGAMIWKATDIDVGSDLTWANGVLFANGIYNPTRARGMIALDATDGHFLGANAVFDYNLTIDPIVVAQNGMFGL